LKTEHTTASTSPQRLAPLSLTTLVGAAGLLVYLVTLNRWISFFNVGVVARVAGWTWQPQVDHPLTWLVLLPSRLLPHSWIPFGLNVLAAICAALVLMLLARSVRLLPHDIAPLPDNRPPAGFPSAERKATQAAALAQSGLLTKNAWVPVLLAVLVCGLQISFWEHATSFTGEMLDLLVFAYVVRCLIEFRVSQEQSWLFRAVLIYGAGMANNWALIGSLPVFLAALLRVKGLGLIFDWRLLLRLSAWALAGLSLYLLLPLVQSLSSAPHTEFWEILRANLKSQKEGLIALRRPALRILALASLLPLGILSVRWKSHTLQKTDDSRLGVFLTKGMVHFVHLLFLLLSLWICLDPTFSPRKLDFGVPMLSYYYMSAIVAGYCAGYFLVFFSGGTRPRKRVVFAASILLCAVALSLIARNSGQIATTNGPALHEFARQLYSDLPAGKSVVLSDHPEQLILLRAELAARNGEKDVLPLDTRSLVSTQYQAFMASQFRTRWPSPLPTNGPAMVGPIRILNLLSAFAAREQLVYLHPSYGRFCERFDDSPHGLVHLLKAKARTTREQAYSNDTTASNRSDAPGAITDLSAGTVAPLETHLHEEIPITNPTTLAVDEPAVSANEQLWQHRWEQNLRLLAEHTRERTKAPAKGMDLLCSNLRLEKERNSSATILGTIYSKALNCWGVQIQRLGQPPAARVWFQRALDLNPDNLAARINLLYNERCQQGDRRRFDSTEVQRQFRDVFSKYHNWLEVLHNNGLVDEPALLFKMARGLLAEQNNRQAVGELARCIELAPDWTEPRLWLALGYIDLRDFTNALAVTDGIKAMPTPPQGIDLAQQIFCRTTALQSLGRTNEAAADLETFISQQSEQAELLSATAELFAQNQRFQNTLTVLEPLLKRDPTNAKLLARKGWAEVQLSKFVEAITTLSKAIAADPSDEEARLQRAIASMGAGQLEAAHADYQELLKTQSGHANALYGLGAIAWRKRDTNAAIDFYQQYLSRSNKESPQFRLASARLRQLKKS
jgi:tetratricopeptide (TPR) repeat protein